MFRSFALPHLLLTGLTNRLDHCCETAGLSVVETCSEPDLTYKYILQCTTGDSQSFPPRCPSFSYHDNLWGTFLRTRSHLSCDSLVRCCCTITCMQSQVSASVSRLAAAPDAVDLQTTLHVTLFHRRVISDHLGHAWYANIDVRWFMNVTVQRICVTSTQQI